jgi:hypothetical protein
MGLDQWCYACDATEIPDGVRVDFARPDDSLEIAYWRKHPNLHGWMQNLYVEKGGTDSQFNCVPVELTLDDLDKLEETIKEDRLPDTIGFFFGRSYRDSAEISYDLDFVRKAKQLILDEDKRVFYTSWW